MGNLGRDIKMRSFFVIALALAIAFVGIASANPIIGNPILDCTKVAGELSKVISDCSAANPDDTTAILECVEEAIETTADVIKCVCELIATFEGVDAAACKA